MHGFFLGPVCKAPEQAHFLAVDAEESMFSVGVDIEARLCANDNRK